LVKTAGEEKRVDKASTAWRKFPKEQPMLDTALGEEVNELLERQGGERDRRAQGLVERNEMACPRGGVKSADSNELGVWPTDRCMLTARSVGA
jgi:hypothetical protein